MPERDAGLPAPVPGGVVPPDAVLTVEPDVKAGQATNDLDAQTNSFNATVRSLAAQELVRIRISNDAGPQFIRINGWSAWYHPGVHMVPKQVAEIFEEAGRI